MEFNDSEPLYIQVADFLEREILDGKYPMNTKIPGVRELSATLVINGRTVQNAVNRLVESGLVETRRGLGNFVTSNEKTFEMIRTKKIRAMAETFIKNSLTFVSEDELRRIIAETIASVQKE